MSKDKFIKFSMDPNSDRGKAYAEAKKACFKALIETAVAHVPDMRPVEFTMILLNLAGFYYRQHGMGVQMFVRNAEGTYNAMTTVASRTKETFFQNAAEESRH